MPKKDTYHDQFASALRKAGYTIVADPYYFRIDGMKLYIDIAANPPPSAKNAAKDAVAVEIKNFVSCNDVSEFQRAVGQYIMYREGLEIMNSKRRLYLAVPDEFHQDILSKRLYFKTIGKAGIKIVTFDVKKETIIKWID